MLVTPKSDSQDVLQGVFCATKRYAVLCVCAMADQQYFGIWSDRHQCVGLSPASSFEIFDDTMPPNWRISFDLNGRIQLGPTRWMVGSFWDDYNDGVESAVRIFYEEVRLMNCQQDDLLQSMKSYDERMRESTKIVTEEDNEDNLWFNIDYRS